MVELASERICIFDRMQDARDIDLKNPVFERLAYQFKEALLQGVHCSGKMTRHELWYKSEGWDGNWHYQVDCCRGHQDFLHSKTVWGNKDFSYLRRLRKVV